MCEGWQQAGFLCHNKEDCMQTTSTPNQQRVSLGWNTVVISRTRSWSSNKYNNLYDPFINPENKILKITRKTKNPSIIVAEMLHSQMILLALLWNNLKSLKNWITATSYTFKSKESALERCNYHHLRLMDQVVKVVERIIKKITRYCIDTDGMQFGNVWG